MITLDFETKSECDLAKCGAWVYSKHPTTDIILVTWKIDSEPLGIWWPDHASEEYGMCPIRLVEGMPYDLYMAVMLSHHVEAHNQPFEYAIWTNQMVARYGWVEILDHQWRDTAATARYYAMPAALDKLSRALGYPPKDPEGTRLISKYSKLHLKTAKRIIPADDFQKWIDYGSLDTILECNISDELGDLPEDEQELWYIDFLVNKFGLYLNVEALEAAKEILEKVAEDLTREFRRITDLNPTQRDKVLEWFQDNGIWLENLQKDHIAEALEEAELPQGNARRALEIRSQIAKSSTNKIDAMLRNVDPDDGRARFQTVYHGAFTGRDTGTGFQPLNLSRGYEDIDPSDLIDMIMTRDPRVLKAIYGNPIEAIGMASRHFIKAAPGNVLITGDFESIEAIVLAFLAGEEWKMKAFKQGVKIYELMAEKIYNLSEGTVTKATHPQERQDGKTGELAFGFGGALGAWLQFDSSGRHTDERIIEICKAWRAEHPAIVQFWYALERAATQAIDNPGEEFRVNEYISFKMIDDWLTMRLPDGKRLWYREPQIRMGMPQWHKPLTDDLCRDGTCGCQPVPQITYLAYKNKMFKRVKTYGGKLAENATQATARQILTKSIKRLHQAGYQIILKVYDEIVCEVPRGFGSLEEFKQLMVPHEGDFAYGWPIRVHPEYMQEYKK